MLGAECSGLPPILADAVAAFLKANVDWLVSGMDPTKPLRERHAHATTIVATLQGAMMIATSLKDHGHFDAAVTGLFAHT